MALRNIFSNQQKLTLQDFEAHNSFTITENINSITHKIDENTGEYVIKNALNNNILSVNLDGTLSNDSYVKAHISNVLNPLTSQVEVHQETLDALGVPNVISGVTTSNTQVTIETIAISNNTVGEIDGFLLSSGCLIKFNLHITNNAGTVSILSYNLEYNNAQNAENLEFVVVGTSLLIKFTNDTGNNNYFGKYSKVFVSI